MYFVSSFKGVLLKAGPRPTDHHGPVARRPDGPMAHRPAAHGPLRLSGPAAWRPGDHLLLLSSGKSTRMQRFASVWACKDGEFEFVSHFNNHLNPFRSFLSLHVAK